MNAKKEPMKDYAVQQKKLYEDVTNYCQRNRDAAVQREDLQLREMMAKKLEEQELLREAKVNSFESELKNTSDRCQENANNLYILLHSVDDLERGMKTMQCQLGRQAPSRIGCNFCGKAFPKDSDLKSHLVSEHKF